jgi:hypothetical protein
MMKCGFSAEAHPFVFLDSGQREGRRSGAHELTSVLPPRQTDADPPAPAG